MDSGKLLGFHFWDFAIFIAGEPLSGVDCQKISFPVIIRLCSSCRTKYWNESGRVVDPCHLNPVTIKPVGRIFEISDSTPCGGKMRQIRKALPTLQKQGSEETPQSKNAENAENADTKTQKMRKMRLGTVRSDKVAYQFLILGINTRKSHRYRYRSVIEPRINY